MRNALIPELRLRQTRMLITKTWLTLYGLDLQPKTGETGGIRAEGKAGTGENKSVDFKIGINKLPIDDGCRRIGASMSPVRRRARFIGAGRIRNWRHHGSRRPCAWTTGA